MFVRRSRFEVDLNRPRDAAVYLRPDDAWGLDVWTDRLPDAEVQASLVVYDDFYAAFAERLDRLAASGPFVVLDVHSYNHRRQGPDGPAAPESDNPEVNVGTGALDQQRWGPVVERFIDDLRAERVAGHNLDVRENVRFRGGHLSRWVAGRYPDTGCVLAIEFKKVFMDEWTGEPDVAHITEIAARARSCGTADARRPGREAAMKATGGLSPDDLAIDHELADIASGIRFLLAVTPVNLLDARRRFFADGGTPEFVYAPLDDDPAVTEARLAAVTVERATDVALAHLLTAKRRELELQLEMLRRRGSDDFLALSLKLYGAVSPALLGDAEALLDCVSVPAVERGERLDAEAFARRAEAELDHYRATGVDLDVHVEVRSDSSGVMVSNGNLLIAPTVTVPESRVHALLQHEVGTHIVTHVNGSHQPLRLLGAGLADNDETQEGLAVFAEYLAGGLTARRLRQLAARVIAVHQMTDGASFTDVHKQLVANGVGRVEAFTITMRVFRSGGLTKDAVYLRGLRNVVTHVGAGGALDALWLGKMALSDVPHIEELRDRGALHEPLLTPRYLADSDAQTRLASITTSTTPVDLIGVAA